MNKVLTIALAISIAIGSSSLLAKNNIDLASEEYNRQIAAEVECLALNIYFETHAVSLADAVAVSDVVLNRVKSSNYPNTVCKVVKQGYYDSNGNPIRHKCQFSWWCDGKSDNPKNYEAWERSLAVAREIYLTDSFIGITEGSTHYHANYVTPEWSNQFTRVTRIGSHIFYRQK